MVSVGSQLWKCQVSRTFFCSPRKLCVIQEYFQRAGNSKTMLTIGCLYVLLYNMCVLLFTNITISISRDSYKHFERGRGNGTNGITLHQMNTSYFTCHSHVVSQFIQIVTIINNTSIDIFVHQAPPLHLLLHHSHQVVGFEMSWVFPG